MDTSFSTTPIPAQATPRRRWWLRGLLMVLGLAILVPLALYFYSNHAARVSWDAAEAEADRTDPDWRMTNLLLARRVVPDEENSALRIIAISAKAKEFQVGNAPNHHEVFAKLLPNTQLNDRQVRLIRDELAKIPGPLEEARQLKDLPYGRLPVKISPIFISTLLPDHQKPRDMSDWLKHDAWLLAHEEKYNDAVESCRACLCTGRTFGDEPFVISHLIRIAIQGESIVGLERVLGQGEAADAALKEMQKLLELEIAESTWVHSLRGERAGCHMLFDDLRNARLPMATLSGLSAPSKGFNLTDFIAEKIPSTNMNYYPEYLEHMTRAVEIAKLPTHEQRAKIQAWGETIKTTDNRVVRMLAPAVEKVYFAHCRSQANLRAAAVGVACERYRLANQRWPASLDVLVDARLIAAVPLDPVDGKALRYRQDKEKIVVYSIGNNEKDDGGHIDREQLDAAAVDVGFRLWRPDQRRRPAQ